MAVVVVVEVENFVAPPLFRERERFRVAVVIRTFWLDTPPSKKSTFPTSDRPSDDASECQYR